MALIATMIALTGCAAPARVGPGDVVASMPVASAASVTPLSMPESTTPDLAQQVLSNLTVDQKIGQLLMVALTRGNSPSGLADLVSHGETTGVLLLGNGWGNDAVSQAVNALLQQNADQPVGLYITADQEGGKVQRLSGDGFDRIPAATVQGTWTTDDLTTAATKWAQQLSAAGVNLNLAPVTDTVPNSMRASNKPIGALQREFGSDPDLVGAQAAAFIQGMTAGGVQTCPKHFPGLGRVTGNTDFSTVGIVDSTTSRDDALLTAFTAGMAAHPAMVMVSLATYSLIDPDNPAAFSQIIVTQMLRGDLGWDGVVISDSMDAAAVKAIPVAQRGVDFIKAGGDIAIFPGVNDLKTAAAGIKQQIDASPDFAALVDAAVLRVLQAKNAAGLLG